MVEAVQVITKLASPPDVPAFLWPPEEWRSSMDSDNSTRSQSNYLGGMWRGELLQIITPDQPSMETHQSITFFSACSRTC